MKPRVMLVAILLAIVLLVGVFAWFFYSEKNTVKNINSFAACAENGYPVQESFPRRCITPDGRFFVEIIERPIGPPVEESPTHSLISVSSPKVGDTVLSPLTVSGLARGYWFFEASFPIELRDAAGKVIATGIAQAQGEWMTEEFVPFVATLRFKNEKIQSGKLILRKDNPSGLPEHDDSFSISVVIGIGASL